MKQTVFILALVVTLVGCQAPSSGSGTVKDRTAVSSFDYSPYAKVLREHVDAKGMVDYRQLRAQRQVLEKFTDNVALLDPKVYEGWLKRVQIAFWLNVYNALTLQLILDHYPIESSFFKSLLYPANSIRQIDGAWDGIRFTVMGEEVTLDHIEHEVLRKKFAEPRIHMALVCASVGCPYLRQEPYDGQILERQLDEQTRVFLRDTSKFRIDTETGIVYVSSIFKWFGGDFAQWKGIEPAFSGHSEELRAVLSFVSDHLPEKYQQYLRRRKYRIEYLDYDWSLNEQ